MEFADVQNDIYIYNSSSSNKYVLYSPLRGLALYVNECVANVITHQYNGVNLIDYPQISALLDQIYQYEKQSGHIENDIDCVNKAVILLSQSCNLSCSYCYASHSRDKTRLSFEIVQNLIDYIFSTQSKKKVFSFLGGGEPTVTWELLKQCIEYIQVKSLSRNIPVTIGLTTNGTLLDEKRIQFLVKNQVRIGISFDVLPDVQDKQRPFSISNKSSFCAVNQTILLLLKHKARFKIRSTITQSNVNRMKEMLLFAINQYPSINEIHFEPVCDIRENNVQYYADFVREFMETFILGREHGVLVVNSITNAFFHIRDHYCVGELCLTPDGNIVACHRHSTKNDIAFSSFVYGNVDEKGVHINKQQLQDVIRNRKMRYEACATCFAQWNCGGGCASVRSTLSQPQQIEYCNFIKTLLKAIMEYKLN